MPLFLRVPLPGPLAYGKQLGGRRRKRPPTPAGAVIGLLLGALVVIAAVAVFVMHPSVAGGVLLAFLALVILTAIAKVQAAKPRA